MALHTVTIFVLGTFRSVAYKCCSTSSILFFSRSIQWAAAPPRPCPWPCRSGRVALQGPARGWLACRAMAWPESWIQGPGLCGWCCAAARGLAGRHAAWRIMERGKQGRGHAGEEEREKGGCAASGICRWRPDRQRCRRGGSIWRAGCISEWDAQSVGCLFFLNMG